MSDSLFDTSPACVPPPRQLICDAKAAIPQLLNVTKSEQDEQTPSPPHKVVNAARLVRCLRKEGHRLDAAEWAIHELIQEGRLIAEGAWRPSAPYVIGGLQGSVPFQQPRRYQATDFSGAAPFDKLVVRSTDGLWDWWQTPKDPSEHGDQGGAGQGEGDVGSSKGGKQREARKRLEQREPLKFQVYQCIHKAHIPNAPYADVIEQLKADKQFLEQVKDAGLKLNDQLVRNAIACFDQRKRDAATKKQETETA